MEKSKELPSKFALSVSPKKYLKQGISHCGAYCVKAILSAYKKDTKNKPEEYHTNWIGRIAGVGLVKKYYVKILKSHGIEARVGNAKNLPDGKKLKLLKKLLSNNNPVMLHVSNGYSQNGNYNPIQVAVVRHWITLWGYNDKEQVFYVYDSAVPKKLYDKDIPIGNKKRSLFRDFEGLERCPLVMEIFVHKDRR